MDTVTIVLQWGVGCFLLLVTAYIILWWFNEWGKQPFPSDFDFQVLTVVLVVLGLGTFYGGSFLIPPLNDRMF